MCSKQYVTQRVAHRARAWSFHGIRKTARQNAHFQRSGTDRVLLGERPGTGRVLWPWSAPRPNSTQQHACVCCSHKGCCCAKPTGGNDPLILVQDLGLAETLNVPRAACSRCIRFEHSSSVVLAGSRLGSHETPPAARGCFHLLCNNPDEEARNHS